MPPAVTSPTVSGARSSSRGPCVTRRLHKVARDEVFDRDGFYRTHDEGRVDGDRIHFLGRLGDMIKTSGANVAPAEVERALAALDDVMFAAVVGVDDDERGQAVAAVVVPEEGARIDPVELRERLRSSLSSYKLPRRILVLDSFAEVPMTPSFKVRNASSRRSSSATASSSVQEAADHDVPDDPVGFEVVDLGVGETEDPREDVAVVLAEQGRGPTVVHRGSVRVPERRTDEVRRAGDRVLDRLEQLAPHDLVEAVMLVRGHDRFGRDAHAREGVHDRVA